MCTNFKSIFNNLSDKVIDMVQSYTNHNHKIYLLRESLKHKTELPCLFKELNDCTFKLIDINNTLQKTKNVLNPDIFDKIKNNYEFEINQLNEKINIVNTQINKHCDALIPYKELKDLFNELNAEGIINLNIMDKKLIYLLKCCNEMFNIYKNPNDVEFFKSMEIIYVSELDVRLHNNKNTIDELKIEYEQINDIYLNEQICYDHMIKYFSDIIDADILNKSKLKIDIHKKKVDDLNNQITILKNLIKEDNFLHYLNYNCISCEFGNTCYSEKYVKFESHCVICPACKHFIKYKTCLVCYRNIASDCHCD